MGYGMRQRFRFRTYCLIAVLFLVACSEEPPSSPAPPPPEVETVTVEAQPVANIVELPGRVQAVRTAEIRARVDGIIEQRLYEEGSEVQAGEKLFLIDPREKQASLNEAQAALARARAVAANVAKDVERYEKLVEDKVVSEQEYDTVLARLRTAQADVAQAEAQVRAAQLRSDYTTVTTPISGRAGRAQVTEGALVSAAEATLLTTVEQFDPIYVIFSQSSSRLLDLRSRIRSGELKIPAPENIAVKLVLEDGSVYPYTGHLDFYALTIDRDTGTADVRAEFPNPDRILLPGQFVEGRIAAGVRPGGITVPQRAVMRHRCGGQRNDRRRKQRGRHAPGQARRTAGRALGDSRGAAGGGSGDRRGVAEGAAGATGAHCRSSAGDRRRQPRPPQGDRPMTPRFFIDRPVFAWVIALGITLAGVLALSVLPVEQYPSIAPPSLTIGVSYPGASAVVLETNVTQVIEQELNGVAGLLYMESTSRSNGTGNITLTFTPGTDIDIAQMEVQNQLSTVEPRLPEEVRRQGIQVEQATSTFLLIIALSSKSGATEALELSDFASSRVVDELRRVAGVGDVTVFSPPYAMRIWLDPDRLANFNLSAADALAAVREQNSPSAGGALGALPLAEDIEINAPIETQGRFNTPEEFAAIILRANADGSAVRLSDVARVELGAESYLMRMALNGKPAAGLGVQLTPGANALATAEGIKTRMAELALTFPPDIGWTIPFDTTPFIRISVQEVLKTLAEAMLLVSLVMFLFLQNWRATVITAIVVPIALAGACFGLWLFDFSINLLTLFGMVLAIGILVDDAIVVVENVERIMAGEGLAPHPATVKAMQQITAPIIGISLVLVAVFVPMAFFPGSTGGIYRQFSVTIAVSVAFSALLALTLTPAMCAALLKPHAPQEDSRRRRYGIGRFFAAFNRGVERTTDRYQRGVRQILRRPLRFLALYALLLAAAAFLYGRLPGGFLPTEDQGSLYTVYQAPPGSTVDLTEQAVAKAEAFYGDQPQVDAIVSVRGFSFFGQGQSHAISFVSLRPWEERPGAKNNAQALVAKAQAALAQVKEALIFVLNPPAIRSLGVAGGFTFKLQDRAGRGDEALLAARDQLLSAAAQSPVLTGVRPEGQQEGPRLQVNIDRIQARALGLSIGDVNSTLGIAFGSAYANDFSREGRIHRVLLQADAPYRMTPEDLLALKARNDKGEMVPFGAFTTVEWTAGPAQLQRYNGYPALTISGNAAPGYATGEALNAMEQLAQALPQGFGYEWTGISYEEKQAAGQIGILLSLSLLVVLMVLAALYESWTVPLAVLLVVPLGVLGAALFAMGRGLPADVYFNVGLITIIGLSAKNAILIVEFALDEEAAGRSLIEATLSAVKMRLRPVVMTSLAFILGMLPLVLSSGAGAASRIAVGTGVMGGMIMATLLGIFFIPLFYLAVRRWLSRRRADHLEV